MNWKYFTEEEILNPYFDDCPHNRWEDLPHEVRVNLEFTMELLEDIRSFMGKRIRITSSYRASQNRRSAHKFGKGIDFQFIDGNDEDYTKAMDYLINDCPLSSFRAILEWQGKGHWIHIDRNYRDREKEVFMIGFPAKDLDGTERMTYRFYNGALPQDMAKSARIA